MATSVGKNVKKKQQQEVAPADLPLDLLQEIFLKLPVKSLIRFKSVSKQRLSMISDSHFTKLHYDAAITATINNNKLMYLSRGYSKAHCVKIEPSIHHDYNVHLQATYKHDKLSIIGSCRGFLLLQNDVPEPVLVLWNPAMGSHTIVRYPDNFWNVDSYFSCSFRGGVVYDKFNDDYLVVLGSIQVNGHVMIGNPKPQWKLFSVRTNSWKDIEGGDCFNPVVIHHRQLGLLYNEAIHWLVMYIGPKIRRGFVIVAFDTVTKTLPMIPLPYPQRPPGQMELSLLGGGGCFGICMR